MRKQKQIIIAACLTLIIALILYFALSRGKMVKEDLVYFASKDIGKNELITMDMLEGRKIPSGSLDNYIGDTDLILNKRAGVDLYKGDQIRVHDLIETDESKDYPWLEAGKRMYSLMVRPEFANGLWLYEGKLIDIYIYDPLTSLYDFSDPNVGLEDMSALDPQIVDIEFLDSDQNSYDLLRRARINSGFILLEGIKILRIMDERGNEFEENSKGVSILSLELSEEEIKILAANSQKGNISIAAIGD